jgi:hypothetical protein
MVKTIVSDKPQWILNKHSHIHYEIEKILASINQDLIDNFLELCNKDKVSLYYSPMRYRSPFP